MSQSSGLDDLLDADDFLSLTTAGPEEQRTLTVSLQDWTTSLSVLAPLIVWETDYPNVGEPQVFATFEAQLSGCSQAEVRLRNDTDGLTMAQDTVSSSGAFELGPEPHTPTTSSDPILVKLEANATHGGTIKLRSPVIRFGIGD